MSESFLDRGGPSKAGGMFILIVLILGVGWTMVAILDSTLCDDGGSSKRAFCRFAAELRETSDHTTDWREIYRE